MMLTEGERERGVEVKKRRRGEVKKGRRGEVKKRSRRVGREGKVLGTGNELCSM